MKQLLLAGLALQLCALPALSQTTATPSTMPPAAPSTSPAPAAPGTPGTRPMTGGTTYSSTAPAATPSAPPPAGANTATASPGAVRGANSFTEAQAKHRLERNGYTQVSGLTKGNDGIWRGTAMKNGSSVQVTVDFKGDISMN
jgi:hypothetical protein